MTEIDPAMDIAIYLNAQFTELKMAGDGEGNNLFVSDLPDNPDFAVAILRYEGRSPTETFSKPLLIRHPRVQITIRDENSEVTLDFAGQILRFLTNVKEQVINGNRYSRIKPIGEPFELGPDSRGRQKASVNFDVAYYDE